MSIFVFMLSYTELLGDEFASREVQARGMGHSKKAQKPHQLAPVPTQGSAALTTGTSQDLEEESPAQNDWHRHSAECNDQDVMILRDTFRSLRNA